MLYNVIQIAKSTGQSKQNIYKKLKKKELIPHIIKKQGITYIDDIGLKIINDSYETNTESNSLDEEVAEDTTYSTINEDMFNLLKKELNDKNLQITEKDIQINKLLELNKNNQILLKDKPQQNILLLEEHFEKLDDKLIDIKEKMLEKHEQQKKKSFFKKLFNK